WGAGGAGDHHVVTLGVKEDAAYSSTTGDTTFTSGTSQRAKTVYGYDRCGGMTSQTTCDFGSNASATLCTSASSYALEPKTAVFPNEPHYHCSTDDVCTSGFCDHPATTTVADASSPVVMGYSYDDGGHALTESRNGFATISTYDGVGNLATRKDPGLHVTH